MPPLPPSTLAFLDNLGGPQLFVIFVLSLMLFGGKKLPELARGVGKAVREFKRAASGVENEFRRAMDTDPPPPRPSARPKVIAPKPAVPAPAVVTPPATKPDDEKQPE